MRRGAAAKISIMNDTAAWQYVLYPASPLHCYLRAAATAIKKPDIEKKGTPNGYLFLSMPGNLVTHRQRLRTRGSVQSAPLFCYRLIRSKKLCQFRKICSPGCPPAEIHTNHPSAFGTFHFNDPGCGCDFI